MTTCTHDDEGFCDQHGWDCADYQQHLVQQRDAAVAGTDEEEVVRDTDDQSPTEPADLPETGQSRTIAFLCDSRASTLRLSATVRMLVERHEVQHALVELDSAAGVRIAGHLQAAGVSYSVLSFTDELPQASVVTGGPDTGEQASLYLSHADQVIQVEPDQLGALHAQLCLVPATAGSGEVYLDAMAGGANLDMSQTTLPGLVAEQAQLIGRNLLIVDTPERGLVQEADGTFRRRVLHVGAQAHDVRAGDNDDDTSQDQG